MEDEYELDDVTVATTTLSFRSLPETGLLTSSNHVNSDGIVEALYLLITASFGFLLNIIVIACLVSVKSRRRLGSIFVLHGCLLDAIKCVYCIPFATSLLQAVPPESCALLGGSFVLVVTASGVNIVAMVCSEAYTFSEQSLGIERRASVCCILFGLVIVYVTSVIIHLGPTIIGGDFNYNDVIGNCIFVYGTVKSYVVHAMWIAIMTLILASAGYYLGIFHRHIQAGTTHRLASILRTVIAARTSLHVAVSSCGVQNAQTPFGGSEHAPTSLPVLKTSSCSTKRLNNAIRNSLSRSRTLIIITSLFVACWYPLYLLTLLDPKFQQPSKLYKVLTFVAWSNAAISPLVFLLFDRNIGSIKRLGCKQDSSMTSSRRVSDAIPTSVCNQQRQRTARTNRLCLGSGEGGTKCESIYDRVGCRLHNEGNNSSVQFQLKTYRLSCHDIDQLGESGASPRDLDYHQPDV